MRTTFMALMASLLSISAVDAFWAEATDSSLEIGVCYRQDRLSFKTEADSRYSGCSGNSGGYSGYSGYNGYSGSSESLLGAGNSVIGTRSHLDWKDINIVQIEAEGKYITCDNVYLRVSADYGFITSGTNHDKDYLQFLNADNTATSFEPVSRTHSKVRGHVYDFSLAAGYQFQMCDNAFSVTPLVGYAWNGQHFKDHHLRFDSASSCASEVLAQPTTQAQYSYSDYYYYSTFSDSSSYSSYSCSDRIHSIYKTRWYGPYIGFDFDYLFNFGCSCENDWDLFGTYEFHFAEFKGAGHWKNRSISGDAFNQRSKNAYGNVFDIGIKWNTDCYTIALKGEFQWWYANHGHSKTKVASDRIGNIDTVCYIKQPLRHLKWNSAAVAVDVGMVF